MDFKWKHALTYAIGIAGALILYFLAINALGLGSKIYMSFFNVIITALGIYFMIRTMYKEDGKHFKYMNGFIAAVVVGFVSTIIFTLFMAVYLVEINPELERAIASQISTIQGTGELSILLFIALSGFATSLVAALGVLPLYKQSWNSKNLTKSQIASK
jgi:hypothetical protein